jgi:hypothetical protein
MLRLVAAWSALAQGLLETAVMRHAVTLYIALLPSLGGCRSSNGSVASCSDVVLTPAGSRPRACVHEVPNGADVTFGDGGTTVVTLNGAVIATYPPCPCAATATCTDRKGVPHTSGLPWMDGCESCSCGDLGDGMLSAICTHNSCPPDASTESDASGDLAEGDAVPDAADLGDAYASVNSAQCQSLMAAYEAVYSSATECTVAAVAQCTVLIKQPFACHCASFINGTADAVTAAATNWTNSGCTEFCIGACALATRGVCVPDPTSPTGGRCADRDVAAKPVGVACTDDTECASVFCERPAGMCNAASGACQDNSAGADCALEGVQKVDERHGWPDAGACLNDHRTPAI